MTVLLSTQILILAMVPFSFISVSIPCEFAMLADVYILLSPQEEDVHSSSWRDRCTHLAAHSSKRLVCLVNTFKKTKTSRQTAKPLEETQKFTFAFCVSWIPGLLANWQKLIFMQFFLYSYLRKTINVKHIKIVVQYGSHFKTEELWFE